MPHYLRLLEEDADDGERFDIVDEFLIGRELPEGGARGFVLAHPEASRRHAIVRRLASGVLELEDLGSKNGTLVNGALVSGRRQLVLGDRVTIGMTIFMVQQDVEETRLSDPRVLPAETAIRQAEPPATTTEVGHAAPRGHVAHPIEEPGPREAAAPRVDPRPEPRPAPRSAFARYTPRAHGGAIASRRQTPTVVTFLAIVATAVALVVYFAMH